MYASVNFKSKKAFKEAVKNGEHVGVYHPGLGGSPPVNGRAFVEGPWYPAPHSFYAEVKLANGAVVSVK